jgi:nucleoid-associated protein YgaU
MLKAKYQNVLDLGEELSIKNGEVKEENGVLSVKGTAANQYEKNILWDAIKLSGGDNPTDIMADILVEDETVYARHTVKKGETLGGIAIHYYGKKNVMKYKEIFEANTDVLKSADVIHPDQELVIPNL